jgi:uncharacterized phiE125 gp8 family phage protein
MQSIIRVIQNRQAASVTEPLILSQAKEWCIISHTDDDALITRLITVARMQVEKKTGLSLVARDIVVVVDMSNPFKLPYGPVTTLTSIERRDGYNDDDPDWTVLTDEDYRFDGANHEILVTPRCGNYRITYVAGFTEDDGDNPVPQDLKDAIAAQVAFLYENRGDGNNAGKFSEVARQLLAGYIDYAHV